MIYQEKLKQYQQKDYPKIWQFDIRFLMVQNIFLQEYFKVI